MLPAACGAYQKRARVGHSCHHGCAGDGGNHERADEANDAQHGFDGEIDRLPAEEDLASAGQTGLAGPLESGKYSIEDGKCCDREEREDAPLQPPRCPEDVAIAKRPEPKQIHPVGEGGLGPEEDRSDDNQ